MEALQNNMKCLYYKNLETYAKKNKIDINIPNYNEIDNADISDISDISDVSETIDTTEVANNTETYTEDFVYKKPWNKLNIIHKCIKMQEYVNNLNIDDPEMKKHLKNHLVTMIKNKKLTKKTDVEYDHINGKIISVPSLQYNNINV